MLGFSSISSTPVSGLSVAKKIVATAQSGIARLRSAEVIQRTMGLYEEKQRKERLKEEELLLEQMLTYYYQW